MDKSMPPIKKILKVTLLFSITGLFILLSPLPQNLYAAYDADYENDIYKFFIDNPSDLRYNAAHKNAEIIIEKTLFIKEFREQEKGFGAKNETVELRELNSGRFDKENRPFKSGFFLKLLLAFLCLCSIEILCKKKIPFGILDIGRNIFTMPGALKISIILSLLIVSLVSFSFFEYNIFNTEAFIYVQLAKDIADGGLIGDITNYSDTHHFGSSSIIPILALPFFMISGGAHIGLLFFCVFYKLLILILLFALVYRFFGPAAAAVSSFMFVFPAQEFAKGTMHGLNAPEYQSILFMLAITFIFFYLSLEKSKADQKDKPGALFMFSLLGFLSGLGIYFDPTCLLITALTLLFMLFSDLRIIFRKHFIVYALSLILGLFPRIWHLFINNFEWAHSDIKLKSAFSFEHLKTSFLNFFPNFQRTAFFNLRRTLIENSKPDYTSPDIVYLLLSTSLLIALGIFLHKFYNFYTSRKSVTRAVRDTLAVNGREFFIFSYIIFYLAMLSFFPKEKIRTRYFFSLYPFIFIIIGISIQNIKNLTPPLQKIKYSLLAASLFCVASAGILNGKETMNNNLENFLRTSGAVKAKGYSILGYFAFLKKSFIDHAENNLYLQDLIFYENGDADFISHLALGMYIGDKIDENLDIKTSNLIDYCVDPRYRTYVYEGFMVSYTNRLFNELYKSFKEGRVSKIIPVEFQQYFYTNFGFRIGKKYSGRLSKAVFYINSLPPGCQAYLARGLAFSLDTNGLAKLINGKFNHMDKYYPLFYRQLGMLIEKDKLRDFIKKVPDEYASFFLQGAGRTILSGLSEKSNPAVMKNKIELIQDTFSFIKDEDVKYIFEGIGLQAGAKYPLFPKLAGRITENPEKDEEKYLPYFYKGYGRGLAVRFMEDRAAINFMLEKGIENKWREYCREGVEKELNLYR